MFGGNETIPIAAENNLIYCSLSLDIMRHPILANDQKHYEASELLAWLKKSISSPTTRGPIIHITYDLDLKNTLDKNYPNDPSRYKEYELQPVLDELCGILQEKKPAPALAVCPGGDSLFRLFSNISRSLKNCAYLSINGTYDSDSDSDNDSDNENENNNLVPHLP